jgi:hypothetical protein
VSLRTGDQWSKVLSNTLNGTLADSGVNEKQSCIGLTLLQTEDGFPHVFGINTLAPYPLTAFIHRPNRLVYLSSGVHRRGGIGLEDLTS